MTISLETTARIDAGKGPDAIVCLHGWCCRTGDFAAQVEALSGTCRVLVLDWQQRLIARNGKCSFTGICKDIIEAIAEAGIERPVLCGHSLGGYLAARLACDYQLPIRGLLILDSALPLPDTVRTAWKHTALQLEAGPWDEVFDGMTTPFFAESERGQVEQSIRSGMQSQPHWIALGLLNEVCSCDWKLQLGDSNLPVHLVASDQGVLDIDAFHELVPGATIERIEGSGHFITVFHGDRVNEIMHAFLQGLPEYPPE